MEIFAMVWQIIKIKNINLWINVYNVNHFIVDVTVCHRGFHGDLNETFLIGNVSKIAEKLVNVTWECLEKAINAGK